MTTPAVLREIQVAYLLHQQLQPVLPTLRDFPLRLAAYLQTIASRQTLHQELGVAAACASCAATPLGSCCFPGVERLYDSFLLLLNLLAGRDLPTAAAVPGKCFFLGPQGCRLLARHYYCQRFLCPELQEQLGAAALARLEAALSLELQQALALEDLLRPLLPRRP